MRPLLRPTAPAHLVRARLGVFGCFATSGLVMGVWAANLPSLDERLDLGSARLGTVLLLLALGALVAMPVVGRACDRFGSDSMTRVVGPFSMAVPIAPALAQDYTVLAVSAFAFGVMIAAVDVPMNVNSVHLEGHYGRPIVSAFHGLWSLGGAVGAGLTALGLKTGLDGSTILIAAAVVGAVLFVVCAIPLLPAPETLPGGPSGDGRRLGAAIVLLLGLVALAGHLSEGAAIDWAAVHTRQVLDSDAATAPIAYAVFSVAMTVVRLFGDPIRERLGSALTLGVAGGLAVTGYALVLAAPATAAAAVPVAFAGWALAGVGLATVVPVIFSEVGAAGGANAGRALSTVTMFGSAGLLLGPASIGHLAEAAGLPTALVVPGVLAAVVAVVGPFAVRAVRGPVPVTNPTLYRHSTMSVSVVLRSANACGAPPANRAVVPIADVSDSFYG